MSDTALDQAHAQMSSIRDMVAALNCDFDALGNLREARDSYDAGGFTPGPVLWAQENPEDAEELAELEAAAGDICERDEAQQRIQEDALSVDVRSGWGAAGSLEPEEFRIVVCTGGPHVQIRGELNEHNEPSRAWLEYQDWGTPMQERVNQPGDQGALIAYAACFYFGE